MKWLLVLFLSQEALTSQISPPQTTAFDAVVEKVVKAAPSTKSETWVLGGVGDTIVQAKPQGGSSRWTAVFVLVPREKSKAGTHLRVELTENAKTETYHAGQALMIRQTGLDIYSTIEGADVPQKP